METALKMTWAIMAHARPCDNVIPEPVWNRVKLIKENRFFSNYSKLVGLSQLTARNFTTKVTTISIAQ